MLVMRDVRHLVGHVRRLSLEGWRTIRTEIGACPVSDRRIVEGRLVPGDTLANGPREVQAEEGRVLRLDLVDDAERVMVRIPAPVVGEQTLERLLALVAERRVPTS